MQLIFQDYVNDINSARFLWKSTPSTIKETHPEIVRVWKICQRLWLQKYAGVYEEIRGFDWSAKAVGLVMAFSVLRFGRSDMCRELYQEDV